MNAPPQRHWVFRAVGWLALLICATAWSAQSHAERRLALVIGNGGYSVGPLANPVNDAALMADTLRSAGFEVSQHENLGYRDLQRAVVTFGRDLKAAGEDTVGMVFYAGHAVQADGENYLIPVDANIQDSLDLRITTLEVSTLMASLRSAGNRLNLVVLDACRNNPFPSISRSGAGGLAKIEAAYGTLLAYSTAPGDVAADGNGRNSPYTAALAKAIRTPGLAVEHVFKRVRVDVMERTGNRQVPWESSSLTGDFIFIDRPPEPVAAAPQTPAPAPDNTAEIEYWKGVAASNDPAAIQTYLDTYPDGLFAALAQQRIAALEAGRAQAARSQHEAAARSAWDAVKDSDDPALLQSVVDRYGGTVYAEIAQVKLDSLTQPAETPQQQTAALPPPAADTSAAGNQAELLFWESIKDSTSKSDYRAYLERFPNGVFTAIAQERAANGYAPQVASLSAPDAAPQAPLDGDWKLIIETDIPNPQARWCRWGESVDALVTVKDGKLDTRVSTNMGHSGQIKLSLAETGADYFAKPQGWGQHLFYGDLDRRGDDFHGEIFITMSNARCNQVITLRRP